MSATNIAKIGIAIPNHLSRINNGAIMALAIIGVKLGGCGNILDSASIIPKTNR